MQCREFEQRLNDVLDERGDPAADSKLLAHTSGCEPCRQILSGQRLLLAGVRASATPSLSAGFSRRTVAAANADPVQTRSQPASKALLAGVTLLASAAAALLALSIVWYARSREPIIADKNVDSPEVSAKDNQPGNMTPGKNKRTQPLRHSAAGGTLAFSQADLLVEAPHFPEHLRDGLDEFAVAFPETVERIGEVERLAPGIRPLRLSFALLWNTLFRALPSVRDNDRQPPPRGCTSHFVDPLRLAHAPAFSFGERRLC